MKNSSTQSTRTSEIYAMVSFGHKEKEGQRSANFFIFAHSGIADAAKVIDPDIKVEWHGPNEWDPIPEIAAINMLTDRHVDGIIVTAADREALNPSINTAIETGIPVINFDADAPASQRLTLVGTDNFRAGYLAGQTMVEWLQGQDDIGVCTEQHAAHLQERLRGFTTAVHELAPQMHVYVAYSSGDIQVDDEGRMDFTEYAQHYKTLLQAHPNIRGLFSTYASPGCGAAIAARELNLKDRVEILAFDFDEDIIIMEANDEIRGTVGQDPYMMGYVSMILVHYARHAAEMPPKEAPGWQIAALNEFLHTHPNISRKTAVKIDGLIAQLQGHSDAQNITIDTGADVLSKERLFEILASNFEDMRESIREKIGSLNAEIEERKQAQEELQKLNEELEQRVQERTAEIARQKYILDTFMANIPDSIYFKDRKSRFIGANQAIARLFGVNDPSELLEKSDFDFFPEEQARPKYEQEQEIIRTGQPILGLEEPDAQGHWALTTKMPLRDEHGEIIGTFGISRDITPLKQAQQALEHAYSEISILNNQLKEENVRMSAELDVARRLQMMILPPAEELQQIKGLDIIGYMKPADEVGGDYYDVLKENGMLHIGIGDVTGHGLESGVLMLMTQTVIRTLIEHGETDPVAFVNTLNRTIYKNVRRMGADKTLTFALIDYEDGQVKIVGQHEELLVIRKNGQVERMDTMDLGFPIGLEEEISQWVATATISLQPGDGVVLYTDGITEAENMERELYGLERLCAIVSRHWDQSAEEIKQAVIDDVTSYIGKQKVYDDLTLVILKQK